LIVSAAVAVIAKLKTSPTINRQTETRRIATSLENLVFINKTADFLENSHPLSCPSGEGQVKK